MSSDGHFEVPNLHLDKNEKHTKTQKTYKTQKIVLGLVFFYKIAKTGNGNDCVLCRNF